MDETVGFQAAKDVLEFLLREMSCYLLAAFYHFLALQMDQMVSAIRSYS